MWIKKAIGYKDKPDKDIYKVNCGYISKEADKNRFFHVFANSKKEAKEEFSKYITWLKIYCVEKVEDKQLILSDCEHKSLLGAGYIYKTNPKCVGCLCIDDCELQCEEEKGGELVLNIHDATEQAYKNGHKAGIKEFAEVTKNINLEEFVESYYENAELCFDVRNDLFKEKIDNLLKEMVKK